VVRNRVKRRVREWFRQTPRPPGDALDIVVIARKGAAALDQRSLAAELDALLGQAARQ
jgi:ribonuclease P protein component